MASIVINLVSSYPMQIFADFAGYSLIAIGLASLFGYRLPANFNYPYISRSPSSGGAGTSRFPHGRASISTCRREETGRAGSGPTSTFFTVMFPGGL